MSSASRSPWPSTTRPARIRSANSGARPAVNRPASRSISSSPASWSRCPQEARACAMLACHRAVSASWPPWAAICGLRGAAACHAASDPRHLAQRAVHGRPRLDQRGQPPRGWHPPHHHQVVTDPAVRIADLGHPEVNIGREPAVQLGLAPAGHRAGPLRGEVEETQIDRLLQLVRAVPGEEHHGRVGLGNRRERLTTAARSLTRAAVRVGRCGQRWRQLVRPGHRSPPLAWPSHGTSPAALRIEAWGPTREECIAEAARGMVDSFAVVAGRPPYARAERHMTTHGLRCAPDPAGRWSCAEPG